MRKTTIAEACTLHARIGWQGLTKKEYLDEGDYYLVTGVDFDNGHIAFDSCHYVTKDRYDQDQHIQLHMDDILVTKDGTIGKVAILDEPIEKPATLNSGVFVVRPKDKATLLPKYLMYVLQSNHFNSFIERIKVGCTIAHLNQEKFYQFEFPLPPVDDQEKIIKVFDTMFSVLYARKLEIQKLDELIKARFVEMFGDMVINPNDWDNCKLGEACDVRDGTHDSPQYYTEGYPLVTSKNVTAGRIDLTDCNLICEEDYRKINQRSKVDLGDILMPMIGTVGNPVIVNVEPDFAIKNVALIKFKEESKVLNSFVKAVLESDYFDNAVISKIRGGTQKFISLGDIRNLEICLPPLNKQEQFEEFLKQVDKSKVAVQKSLDETQKLFDSLMQEYFG